MRFMSNGMGSFIIVCMRGSFITFAFTRSRWARDLYTIHENTAVSPALSLAARAKDTPNFTFRSSPAHSRYSRAPCCRHTRPARCAIRRYVWRLRFGTAKRKPSTYGIGLLRAFRFARALQHASGLTNRVSAAAESAAGATVMNVRRCRLAHKPLPSFETYAAVSCKRRVRRHASQVPNGEGHREWPALDTHRLQCKPPALR